MIQLHDDTMPLESCLVFSQKYSGSPTYLVKLPLYIAEKYSALELSILMLHSRRGRAWHDCTKYVDGSAEPSEAQRKRLKYIASFLMFPLIVHAAILMLSWGYCWHATACGSLYSTVRQDLRPQQRNPERADLILTCKVQMTS